ncbi:hypothetical protein [Mucilaginibacter myungsuensis]|uniref:Uncharacterized protein n=1 Tax=Mucilaginibacter myungsuensis TaxID=649104 RepID=A0A929L2E0_9SPHI|nr:hypothetical protein [Mucilaginibacter myungsuensis]MBE9664373.1 hypothetical protein [Mucilaginibacter myungsuensis]MDN3597083.1 hypothetical protein [Mucilaginibacter myungsuensis]
MESFRPFDQVRVNELTVIRHGFVRPCYTLTDGQFVYGKLSYTGWFKPTGVLETATNSWHITPKGLFSRTLYISMPDVDQVIGEVRPELWGRKIKLEMTNGFDAFFTMKKVFSRTYTMMNAQHGDLFDIETKLWKMKTPFKISFDPIVSKAVTDMPLLFLLGIYLVLMRQQQAAAA